MVESADGLNCDQWVLQGKQDDPEVAFSIELVTDFHPEETQFIVMEMNEANPLSSLMAENEPTSGSLLSALDSAGGFNTFVFNTFETTIALNETATFALDPVTAHVLGFGDTPGRITTYHYGTCLPRNSCAAVLVGDTFPDGIEFPGRFDCIRIPKKSLVRSLSITPTRIAFINWVQIVTIQERYVSHKFY